MSELVQYMCAVSLFTLARDLLEGDDQQQQIISSTGIWPAPTIKRDTGDTEIQGYLVNMSFVH
jgi:hypothetical protein